jgi:hypothetical protein
MITRKYPDLIKELAVIQRETYRLLLGGLITVDGNWSNGSPRGFIRTDLIGNGGQLVGQFEFEPSVYDVENNQTILNPFLPSAVTASLPITSWKDGQKFSSRNALVYDFEIALNGQVKKLAYGFLTVIGSVTAPN